MLSIRRSNVPLYLQNSEFFLALNEDDDEELSIDEANLKMDDVVNDESSLRHLLSTLRFWGPISVPHGIYYSAMDMSHTFFESVASEFERELTFLSTLCKLRTDNFHDPVLVAAKNGSVELVKYLIENGHDFDLRMPEAASGEGHLACLRYLHSVGCPWDESTCTAAAKSGQFECLKFAHENGCHWTLPYMAHYASVSGSLPCLKYVIENGSPAQNALHNKLVKIDAVDCVKYLRNRGVLFPLGFGNYAVSMNALKCVKFALELGSTFTDQVLISVQSVECMQLLHDTGYVWTTKSAAYASRKSVEILQFLHEHGCPWDDSVYDNALCNNVVTANNAPYIDCIVYAHTHGCPWSSETLISAVKRDNLPAVEYMLTHGCPADATATAEAVGNLRMLKYLHSMGVPWDTRTTNAAAERDSLLPCLQFACANKCPIDEKICLHLANGTFHFAALRYLHSIGCQLYRPDTYVVCSRTRELLDSVLPPA